MSLWEEIKVLFGIEPKPKTQNFSGQVARPSGVGEPVLAIARAFLTNPKRFKFSMVSRNGNLVGLVRDSQTGEKMQYYVATTSVLHIPRYHPEELHKHPEDTPMTIYNLKWYYFNKVDKMRIQFHCDWMTIEEKDYLRMLFIDIMHMRLVSVWNRNDAWLNKARKQREIERALELAAERERLKGLYAND